MISEKQKLVAVMSHELHETNTTPTLMGMILAYFTGNVFP